MENENKSNLLLDNRKKITLTGVIDVQNFEEDKICLCTKLGDLIIKGNGMKINKIDVQSGDVIIIGSINSIMYNDKSSKCQKESFIKKILK